MSIAITAAMALDILIAMVVPWGGPSFRTGGLKHDQLFVVVVPGSSELVWG
ncbi:hypothetical protein [Corynebacterium spheniscorum]|uniref:hypothetical protein n=1 Tax=Corynebacterium spheniscorum TaxID=185761 RepID=UPI0015A614B7|nr:hypothetical protein [Corynebacterium spheniscorum]